MDAAAGKLKNIESRLERSKKELDDLENSLDVEKVKREINESKDKRDRYALFSKCVNG